MFYNCSKKSIGISSPVFCAVANYYNAIIGHGNSKRMLYSFNNVEETCRNDSRE